MNYVHLNSSVIEYVGYNASASELTVAFHSGRIYVLPDVPEHHYWGLLNAESAGRYWNEHLRGQYRGGERVA